MFITPKHSLCLPGLLGFTQCNDNVVHAIEIFSPAKRVISNTYFLFRDMSAH